MNIDDLKSEIASWIDQRPRRAVTDLYIGRDWTDRDIHSGQVYYNMIIAIEEGTATVVVCDQCEIIDTNWTPRLSYLTALLSSPSYIGEGDHRGLA